MRNCNLVVKNAAIVDGQLVVEFGNIEYSTAKVIDICKEEIHPLPTATHTPEVTTQAITIDGTTYAIGTPLQTIILALVANLPLEE